MSNSDVADRIALQDVMLRYAAGVDERDFDMYASCFADDVEVVNFGPDPIHGRDAWVSYVKTALEKYGATQHMLGPQYAVINGDDATTRSAVREVWETHGYAIDPHGAVGWLAAAFRVEEGVREDSIRRTILLSGRKDIGLELGEIAVSVKGGFAHRSS